MINLFKKTETPHTIIHPDYKKLIEYVTTIEGRKLYKFKNLLDMPHDRYNKCTRFSTEVNMRLDSETLKESLEQIIEFANQGNFTKVMGVVHILMEMTNMLISIDASYRLASCVYFWDNEDLTDYDFEIGDHKISLFKKMRLDDFFLKEPMKNFLPQMSISEQGLEAYLLQEREFKKILSSQLKKMNEKSGKLI